MSTCVICRRPVEVRHAVVHHCHLTGDILGLAHYKCNLEACYDKNGLSVFAHNLRGYDAHFLIADAHQHETKNKINIIANNFEKYMTFDVCHNDHNSRVRFIDSFQHLSSSLEFLVDQLTQSVTTTLISIMTYFLIQYKHLNI